MLAEHLFELVDEAFRERMVYVFAGGFRELLEQLALARSQTLWSLDHDLHELIAAAVAMQIDDALALKSQDFSRLCAGRNLQLDLAFECRARSTSELSAACGKLIGTSMMTSFSWRTNSGCSLT